MTETLCGNAIDQVQTLATVRSESTASPRLTAVLLGLFAALALVITAAGLAGVMALTVSQRTHEIGIRMALGATTGSVLHLVLRQGLTLVGLGLALGLVGAFALTQLMSTLLFAVAPTDPERPAAVTAPVAGWMSRRSKSTPERCHGRRQVSNQLPLLC